MKALTKAQREALEVLRLRARSEAAEILQSSEEILSLLGSVRSRALASIQAMNAHGGWFEKDTNILNFAGLIRMNRRMPHLIGLEQEDVGRWSDPGQSYANTSGKVFIGRLPKAVSGQPSWRAINRRPSLTDVVVNQFISPKGSQ